MMNDNENDNENDPSGDEFMRRPGPPEEDPGVVPSIYPGNKKESIDRMPSGLTPRRENENEHGGLVPRMGAR